MQHYTSHLPHLAVRVFDGHLCITQRFLYGSRPYADVIAFADSLAAEAQRLGAARGHAFAVTLRGEARLLSGQLDAAEQDLVAGGRLHRAIGGATGEALSLQRRSELAMYRGRLDLAWLPHHLRHPRHHRSRPGARDGPGGQPSTGFRIPGQRGDEAARVACRAARGAGPCRAGLGRADGRP